MRTLITLAILAVGTPVTAANLAKNGGFEQASQTNAELGHGVASLTDWGTPNGGGYIDGVMFVYAPGGADTVGGTWTGDNLYGHLQLWGPNDGSNNGLTASSPAGGNFVAFDSDNGIAEGPSFITQTIDGLVTGGQYSVKFNWGAAQYRVAGGSQFAAGSLWNGPTFSSFHVSLGNQTINTSDANIDSHGFSGWKSENFVFTATGASEVLKFLAVGTAGGLPPVALLDGVSVDAVPEPATWALLIAGFGIVGLSARYRRISVAA